MFLLIGWIFIGLGLVCLALSEVLKDTTMAMMSGILFSVAIIIGICGLVHLLFF